MLRGDSYQRGLQYGRALGKHLDAYYDWFVGEEPQKILVGKYRTLLENMESRAARHFPQLVEEIKGWSDGSGLSIDKCRIMAYHNEVRRFYHSCSNVSVIHGPDGSWLARNCDIGDSERSWQVMKIALCDDCYSHVTITYIGIPFGLSINSAGLAAGDASLPSRHSESLDGLPYFAAFLHATQASVSDCIEKIREIPNLSRGAHIPLLDSSGDAVAAELGNGRFSFRRPDPKGFLIATNHSVTGEIPTPEGEDLDKFFDNSRTRYRRLKEIFDMSNPGEWTLNFALKTMADHKEKRSICQHGIDGLHTAYSFVAQPAWKKMLFCWGYPCSREFEVVDPKW